MTKIILRRSATIPARQQWLPERGSSGLSARQLGSQVSSGRKRIVEFQKSGLNSEIGFQIQNLKS
jgi:hypothetical protein